jgi:ATPase subunit of ABC transporter with duplicated ATPase domains
MLIIHNVSYVHPDKDVLFEHLNLTVSDNEKIALVGNNGSGKSTLLKIIAGLLPPAAGDILSPSPPFYVPQIFGQYNELTVAEALKIDQKLGALKEILEGNVTEENLTLLDDDWNIEERCAEALQRWQLHGVALTQKLETLSGGQKTKVFLAGIDIHRPRFVLLDEPSNHLDSAGRELLYDFIVSASCTILVVSHDQALLTLLPRICELTESGIALYGGNYDFYLEQKTLEDAALHEDVKSTEKALRKAKEVERETMERQQRLDSRGKKKQENAGVARIMMNTLRNSAENNTAKMKSAHAEKIGSISEDLRELRAAMPDRDKMKFGFDSSLLHKGKVLFKAKRLNFSYGKGALWEEDLTLEVVSGERIALKGSNGSGKTTLIKIIIGQLTPQHGEVYSADNKSIYIDQDYSLIDNLLSVYDQAQSFNTSGLQEHEIKIRLHWFLFTKDDWEKPCNALSGGEKMRLMLCCLSISNEAPDIIVLDEPTNNLDIRNTDILTTAIQEYKGTLIVVSHDSHFLVQIGIDRMIEL